jgi:Fanconi-associated nuclease 1
MSLLDYWDTKRPSVKRRRLLPEVSTPESKSTRDSGKEIEDSPSDETPTVKDENTKTIPTTSADEGPLKNDEDAIPNIQTELESALPTIETDTHAIEEYESSQRAKEDEDEELSIQERMRDGKWRKGTSSIYVDAFNLALDTVLGEEAHLFNEAENEIFQHWRELSYESQYLYVLLWTMITYTGFYEWMELLTSC